MRFSAARAREERRTPGASPCGTGVRVEHGRDARELREVLRRVAHLLHVLAVRVNAMGRKPLQRQQRMSVRRQARRLTHPEDLVVDYEEMFGLPRADECEQQGDEEDKERARGRGPT